MELTELKEQIRIVAITRQRHQESVEAKKRAVEEWEKENVGLLNLAEITAYNKEEAEAKLREMTLDFYEATGEKKPAPGVAIREVTKLEYDPEKALSYAKEHGVALKLDVAAFEKMAKIPELKPSFVNIKTEARATIATDLVSEGR